MSRPVHLMDLPTPAPAIRAILERRLPAGWRLLVLERKDQAQRLKLLGEADALISGGRAMTQAELDAAPQLRVVQHQGLATMIGSRCRG